MDLLRKSSLSTRNLHRSTERPIFRFPFSSDPDAAKKNRWHGNVPALLISLLLPFLLSSVFAGPLEESAQSRLKQLKIAAFKRELRLPPLPKKSTQTERNFFKLYTENRFQALVQAKGTLPSNEEGGYIPLVYGNSLLFLGNREAAVAAYQEAFQFAASPQEKAAALTNFGLVFSMSERWGKAVQWLEKALEIDRASDNWRGQGRVLSQLGVFYFKRGNAEKGAAAHIEALEIAETIPIPWLEARQLSQLGRLYYQDKTLHFSRDFYIKALKIYKKLDDALSTASALTALSFVYKDLGLSDKTLSFQSEALEIYHQLNDHRNESKVLLNLSLIYRDQDQFQAALDVAKSALRIQQDLGDVRELGAIEGTIGTIHEKKLNIPDAIRHLKKAREYFTSAHASQEIHIVDLRIQTLQDQMD